MNNLKYSLIILTLVSVVADSMLLPFYSQFFAEAFDVHSSQMVGYYIAVSCLTVTVSFPFWTRVAEKVNEVHLWIYTQIIAGILGLACYYTTSLLQFWILSQLMLMFKASYLLIYPFVIRLEEKEKHVNMVSLFSVLMHFGAIGGALLGGVILQMFNAKDAYLVMPFSDAIQVVVCIFIILKLKVPFSAEKRLETVPCVTSTSHKRFILNLGVVSMLFYFSVFLIRPFFSLYWQSISEIQSEVLSGFVYSIPGWVALVGLWFNNRSKHSERHIQSILAAICIAIAGLMIQSSEQAWIVVLGRGIFGWGLFQATVRLEVFMFARSTPDNYAKDFSRVYLFQNIGVIGASFAIGYIVDHGSLVTPFYIGTLGLIVSTIYFAMVFKKRSHTTSINVQEAK